MDLEKDIEKMEKEICDYLNRVGNKGLHYCVDDNGVVKVNNKGKLKGVVVPNGANYYSRLTNCLGIIFELPNSRELY